MATGAAKARATLKYALELYTPYALETWPMKELRREYTRLRNIAQKRIKRLAQSDVGHTSDVYREFSSGFPTLKALGSTRTYIEIALADVARFVRSPASTVGGAREEFKRRLSVGGINVDDVSAEQYMSLAEWWELVKANGVYYYPSDVPVMYWREKGGYNVSIDDFYQWKQGARSYGKEWEYEEGSSSADVQGKIGGSL